MSREAAHGDPERAKKGDRRAQERDPHGKGAGEAADDEPKGSPSSDRHAAENAAHRVESDRE